MADVTETLDQREAQYGDYSEVAKISQLIKNAVDTGCLSHAQRESLDMMATKMARIVCGDSDNVDHWLDIEGYARLVRNILERKNG